MKDPNNVNVLIDSLVKSFKEFDKSLKNKIRVNAIFSSLDDNTNKNFSKLINLSGLRYKSVKSGVKLNNILNLQKRNYENLIEELKNDKLYSPNILDNEKSKLLKNSFEFRNKEINKIRNKLKTSLKFRENIYEYKRKKQNKDNLPKIRSIIKKAVNLSYIKNFNQNKIAPKKLENQNDMLINTLIEEDYKRFNNRIDTYHNFLNNIRTLSENNKNKKNLKIDKTIFKDTIDSINPKSFRALTYTEDSSKKSKKIKKKDFEFDLRKIKNIKMSHDKNYNIMLRNKNFKISEINNNSSATNIPLRNKSIISTSNNLIINNFSNTLNSQNNSDFKRQKKNKSLDKDKLNDFKNTANIILNETENGLFYTENFEKKRNKLNNHYKFFKTFSKSIDKPMQSLKEKTIQITKDIKDDHKINLNKNDKQKEKIIIIKDYNEKNTELIKKKFQEIYDQKKIKWKKEDKLRDLKKELDRQNMFEVENFLFEIQDKNLLKKNRAKNK